MKRQIKFRGYNLKNKKWLYGYYLMNRGQHFIAEEGLQPPGMTWEDFEVDPESVGQYVGKNDKNDREIYEGDKIRFGHLMDDFPILWSDDLGRFIPSFVFDELVQVEVIGNEYEEKIKK